MKTRFLLIILSIISLIIGCGINEEGYSICYTQMTLYFETREQSYKEEIAGIRDPDGTWSTLEQCLKQKDLAQDYLDQYKKDEKEINANSSYKDCSDEEKNIINDIVERLIIEMEAEVNMNYSCDPEPSLNVVSDLAP